MMDTKFYHTPAVEVMVVTKNNLEEVAEWCGGRVAQAENTRRKGQIDSFVWVPTPPHSKSSNAYPGMYVTRRLVVTARGEMRFTFSIFEKKYFEANYFSSPADANAATWERELKERFRREADAAAQKEIEKRRLKRDAAIAQEKLDSIFGKGVSVINVEETPEQEETPAELPVEAPSELSDLSEYKEKVENDRDGLKRRKRL